MKRSTYMKAVLVTVEGEQDLVIGLCDRMAAEAKWGCPLEDISDDKPSESERWLAYAAWSAAKRQLSVKAPFETWLRGYVGMEMDDGQESPGTAPV